MRGSKLLIVTAALEVGTGLLLLLLPSIPLFLLLGQKEPAPATTLVGRVAGAALLSLGIACWLARYDTGSAGQRALLVGILVYNIVVAATLAYAGLFSGTVGIALWPGVVLHSGLAIWCVQSLGTIPRDVS